MGFQEKWKLLTYGMYLEKIPIFYSSASGKKIPIIKTLLSNYCINNCIFCPYRNERKISRTFWEKEKLIKLTISLTKSKRVNGLFLSSGIFKDPEITVEKQIEVIEELRKRGYKGYIHLTLMPGISLDLMKKACEFADRVGINIEYPKAEYYNEAKIYLDFLQDTLKRIRLLSKISEYFTKKGKKVDVVTQFIVGSLDESDKEILEAVEWLYKKLNLKKIYFSAFEPFKDTPLEKKEAEKKEREKRLYKASFLIKYYNFSYKEFKYDDKNNLIGNDPKDFVLCEKKEKYCFSDLIKFKKIGIKKAKRLEGNYSLLKFIKN
jgi:predicted DNA-binding helix-hairpin-helix protein